MLLSAVGHDDVRCPHCIRKIDMQGSDLPWAGGALDLFVLSVVSYVLQHYNIARSMHVVFTYVAGRQQYGTCSPACVYKHSLTSSFICRVQHMCIMMEWDELI
jgi:hypothetical protein